MKGNSLVFFKKDLTSISISTQLYLLHSFTVAEQEKPEC